MPATPGLQLAHPDGTVTYLADDGLRGPNDLAVAADGAVYFTDPGHCPPTDEDSSAASWSTTATDRSARSPTGFFYCNGIAFEPDGTVVVVERRGLQRVHADGSREWVIETLGRGGGDGFCLDADGRFYVASTIEHGIRVVEPDGTIADFWPIEGKGLCDELLLRRRRPAHAVRRPTRSPATSSRSKACPTPGLPLPTWPGPA